MADMFLVEGILNLMGSKSHLCEIWHTQVFVVYGVGWLKCDLALPLACLVWCRQGVRLNPVRAVCKGAYFTLLGDEIMVTFCPLKCFGRQPLCHKWQLIVTKGAVATDKGTREMSQCGSRLHLTLGWRVSWWLVLDCVTWLMSADINTPKQPEYLAPADLDPISADGQTDLRSWGLGSRALSLQCIYTPGKNWPRKIISSL